MTRITLALTVLVSLAACADPVVSRTRPSEVELTFPAAMGYAQTTRGPRWYAVHLDTPDYTLYLHANQTFIAPPPDFEPVPTTSVRGYDAYETVNETIRVLTWDAEGQAISVEIDCLEPADPRCTEPEFLREVAASLEEA